MTVCLIQPDRARLPGYLDALGRGWTPEADLDPDHAAHLIARIEHDTDAFLAALTNPEGKGAPVRLDDGRSVPRLPFLRHWIFDDDRYAGELNLRWQTGTSSLPDYCLGHLGYAVVPWMRGAGYASSAIRLVLPLARQLGLSWLDISMRVDNTASRRTAERAGAIYIKTFDAGSEYGDVEAALYRIDLT
jgi:predicted acetyltransferase